MRRIFKYELGGRLSKVTLKTDHVISVINQGGIIVVYAVHDDDLPEEEWLFILHGTGHELELIEHMPFLGTVEDGIYVWHIYYDKVENINWLKA